MGGAGHLLTAVALAITLIGILFAGAHMKLEPISLWPIGKTIIEREADERLQRGGQG